MVCADRRSAIDACRCILSTQKFKEQLLTICTLCLTIQNRQVSTAVANIMAALAKALPSYAWLTALPQLISRICHVNPEVNTVTNHIITHVAEAYPQQVSLRDCCIA